MKKNTILWLLFVLCLGCEQNESFGGYIINYLEDSEDLDNVDIRYRNGVHVGFADGKYVYLNDLREASKSCSGKFSASEVLPYLDSHELLIRVAANNSSCSENFPWTQSTTS